MGWNKKARLKNQKKLMLRVKVIVRVRFSVKVRVRIGVKVRVRVRGGCRNGDTRKNPGTTVSGYIGIR